MKLKTFGKQCLLCKNLVLPTLEKESDSHKNLFILESSPYSKAVFISEVNNSTSQHLETILHFRDTEQEMWKSIALGSGNRCLRLRAIFCPC